MVTSPWPGGADRPVIVSGSTETLGWLRPRQGCRPGSGLMPAGSARLGSGRPSGNCPVPWRRTGRVLSWAMLPLAHRPTREPPRLLTGAACGALGSPPARRTRRAYLHHWHSTVRAGDLLHRLTPLSGHTTERRLLVRLLLASRLRSAISARCALAGTSAPRLSATPSWPLPGCWRFRAAAGAGRNRMTGGYAVPVFHSSWLASRAPSAIAASFAQVIFGSTGTTAAKVAKPQSLPATTFSRPTTSA